MKKNYDDFSSEMKMAIDSFKQRTNVLWKQKTLKIVYNKDSYLQGNYSAKALVAISGDDNKTLFSLIKEICQYEFFTSTTDALDVAYFARDKNYFLPLIQENEKEKYDNVKFGEIS